MLERRPLLVVFLDGVGIGVGDPRINPFFAADLPTLTSLLQKLPTLIAPTRRGEGEIPAIVFPVDATLGLEGTPQSGTGQTSLLTGLNGAEAFGRHFGPWVPTALRPRVEEESFLLRVQQYGAKVAFANAYPDGWPGERGGRRVAGPPLAAQGAGLLTRNQVELGMGRAIASGIVNDGWIEHLGFSDLPRPDAAQVGRNLAGIAVDHDLTFYAHYATDTAGHRGGMNGAIQAIELVDAFLGGILDGRPAEFDILVCSDHGNLEDVRTGHTRNPSLGLLIGPRALQFDPSTLPDLTAIASFVEASVPIPNA